MTHKVGPKGQVVIPKAVRERVGISPGSEVDVVAEGRRVIVTVHKSAKRLGGRFAGSGMAAHLLRDRASEPR